MYDILDIDPHDEPAVVEFVKLLKARLEPGELAQLLADLAAWEAVLSQSDRDAFAAYRHAHNRNEVTPRQARRQLRRCARLAQLPEWQAVMRWRDRILALKPLKVPVSRRRAAPDPEPEREAA